VDTLDQDSPDFRVDEFSADLKYHHSDVEPDLTLLLENLGDSVIVQSRVELPSADSQLNPPLDFQKLAGLSPVQVVEMALFERLGRQLQIN